jgi:hypothetical protein
LPHEIFGGLSSVRESAGIMEWWSYGVMQKPLEFNLWLELFPTLQYSKTPVLQYCWIFFPGKPLKPDLHNAEKDRTFSKNKPSKKGEV